MKPVTRNKKVYYKRAEIEGHQTLQSLLKTALAEGAAHHKASSRHEAINTDSSDCRLINHHREHQGMLFCQMIFIESGKTPSFLDLDEGSQEYKITQWTADAVNSGDGESPDKKKREFIDSILYFGVLDNHVAVVQSMALRTLDLENHLGWFLGSSCAALLLNKSALILKDTPSADAIEALKSRPAKSLRIGTPLRTEPIHQEVTTVEQTFQTEKVKFRLDKKVANILRELINKDTIDGLKLEDALEDANLRVHVELTYDRTTTECGQNVLDTIATSMRHMPDEDFKIMLKGGGIIQGNELKISGSLKVSVINGNVDESGLCTEMHKWLVQQTRLDHVD